MKTNGKKSEVPGESFCDIFSTPGEPIVIPVPEMRLKMDYYFEQCPKEKIIIRCSFDPEEKIVSCSIRQKIEETVQQKAAKRQQVEAQNSDDTQGVILNWAQLLKKASDEAAFPDNYAFSIRGVAGSRDVVDEIVRR